MNPDTAQAAIVREAHALAHTVGVRVRDDLRLLRVRGDDRLTWLSGQVTNDVRGLASAPGTSVHALSINVRGKILGELWISATEDQLHVFVPEAALARVMESFEHYIIMEDVVLESDANARVISVQGPRANDAVARVPDAAERAFVADELGAGGMFVATTAARAEALANEIITAATVLGGCAVSEPAFELARVRAGKPRFGVDFDDTTYPQEAGLKSALSFSKGCYLGQEVVCTLESRGRLHRRLCVLEAGAASEAPTSGSTLQADGGHDAATLTGAIFDPELGRWLAFGYVKRAHSVVGAELSGATGRFHVRAIVGDLG